MEVEAPLGGSSAVAWVFQVILHGQSILYIPLLLELFSYYIRRYVIVRD